jgi:hypothetical protein
MALNSQEGVWLPAGASADVSSSSSVAHTSPDSRLQRQVGTARLYIQRLYSAIVWFYLIRTQNRSGFTWT